MDPVRFDTLVKSLSTPATRRWLVRQFVGLSLAGVVAVLLGHETAQADGSGAFVGGHRHRRRAHHRHRSRSHKHHRRRDKSEGCRAQSRAKTCTGVCGMVENYCGRQVDCGFCGLCLEDVDPFQDPRCDCGGKFSSCVSTGDQTQPSCRCTINGCNADGPPRSVNTSCCSCQPE
jgi:hypothetical protein